MGNVLYCLIAISFSELTLSACQRSFFNLMYSEEYITELSIAMKALKTDDVKQITETIELRNQRIREMSYKLQSSISKVFFPY